MTLFLQRVCTTFPSFAVSEFERLALRHLHRGDLDLALVVLSRPAGQRITFLRIHLSLRVRGMQFSYTEAQGLFSSATLIQVPRAFMKCSFFASSTHSLHVWPSGFFKGVLSSTELTLGALLNPTSLTWFYNHEFHILHLRVSLDLIAKGDLVSSKGVHNLS